MNYLKVLLYGKDTYHVKVRMDFYFLQFAPHYHSLAVIT